MRAIFRCILVKFLDRTLLEKDFKKYISVRTDPQVGVKDKTLTKLNVPTAAHDPDHVLVNVRAGVGVYPGRELSRDSF